MPSTNKIELIATSTFGLEAIVGQEVRMLGYDARVENGKATFETDLSGIARANLWLRSADRIRLKVGEFEAFTFDELFEETKKLPWSDWLPRNAWFPVDGKSVKSDLFSVSDCQAIVKRSIVEQMKGKYKQDWFDEDGPLYRIEVSVLNNIATLTIDTSGVALHKRGYRSLIGDAPLKETMAAALIRLSKWNPDTTLIDPFCGSGTIPIEAALMGKNIAPGMNREFASEHWSAIPKEVWKQARMETHDLAQYDRPLDIIGTDIDDEALKIARENAEEAMVGEDIHFQRQDVSEIRSSKKYGKIISNPPYGERIGEQLDIEQLYKQMGQAIRPLDTWSYYFLTSHETFEKSFGKRATKKRKLFNGNLKVDYYQYFGPRPPRRKDKEKQE